MSGEMPVPEPPSRVSASAILAWVFGGIVFVGLLIALLLPAVSRAPEAALRNTCHNHLKQIQLALLNYEDKYKSFPPAYIADDHGKPMHSWRVLILPFLGRSELYEAYDFDEPWDGPRNQLLADEIDGVFSCPKHPNSGNDTNYLAVVGPEASWAGAAPVNIADFHDGTSQTISVVEVANSGIHWMEPRDLAFDDAIRGINPGDSSRAISSRHASGATVGFADGHVHFLMSPLPATTLRALLTKAGGEEFDDNEL